MQRLLRPAVIARQPPRCLAQFLRLSFRQINPIDDAHDCGFDRHVLVSDRRTRRFTEGAHYRLARPRAKPIRDHDDVSSWLFVQTVRMHD